MFHSPDVMSVDFDRMPLVDRLVDPVPLATTVQIAIVRFGEVIARSHYGYSLYNRDL